MIIRTIEVTSKFRYLWLKSVTGVNLNQHCAKCLVGEYDERISPSIVTAENLELADGIYYLCGVASPYNWVKNFHLAFRSKPGESIKYDANGVSVTIDGAERLPIDSSYIDPDNPNAGKKAYSTCRNWQFAHYFDKRLR